MNSLYTSIDKQANTQTQHKMNSLYTSIELNDRAVSLLEQGDIEQALLGFRRAMAVSKRCLAPRTKGHDTTDPQTHSLDTFMMTTSVEDVIMKNQQEQEQQQQHVYRQAIRFASTTQKAMPTPIMVSTGVIFNLALAMQLLACGNNDTASLNKSHQLYQLAHKCLSMHQHGELLNMSPLFVLAIMNNIGMIHTQLNQYSEAQQMFQKVMQMIMFLTDCGEGHTIIEKLGNNSTCFFNNVQSFITPVVTAAAA